MRKQTKGVNVGNLNGNPNINKVVAVGALICGLILTSGTALRAQQPSDERSDSNSANSNESKSAPRTTTDNAVPPAMTLTFSERVRLYEKSFTNPESLIGPVLGAGIGQARNSPEEWGGGAEGFGIRVASGVGRSVISRTIAFGVAAADGEDSRYTPSNETGAWRRTKHAIASTFVSRTRSGGTMPAFSRFAGVYGAGFIANYWEPPSQNSASHAFERGSTALASSVGWHIFEEFWPDIRKALHHRQE